MRVKKRSRERKLIGKIVIFRYYLKLEEQKCLKVGCEVIRHGQQDKAKKKYKKYENQKNINDKRLK